jgi:choline-sulfatase
VLPNPLYPDLWVADRALEQLAAMPNDRPWLLWVSFVGPHEPFDTPPPWHGTNQPESLPAPQPAPAWLDDLPADCELRQTQASWAGHLTGTAIGACRADYADHLQLLDAQVAKLLEALGQRPDQARTAVAVTADHGELLGDAGLLYKGTFLEGAIRVPWIYRPPQGCQEKPGDSPAVGSFSLAPLSLTGLLKKTLAYLVGGGQIQQLESWAQHQPGAVVEFGAELLLQQGPRKLALDRHGNSLWAVHLVRDPGEQMNVITSQPHRWRWSPAWRRLRRWGREEWKRRSEADWIWRQLETNP